MSDDDVEELSVLLPRESENGKIVVVDKQEWTNDQEAIVNNDKVMNI